jgi:sulfur carrier protein
MSAEFLQASGAGAAAGEASHGATIQVNGEARRVSEDCTLEALLLQMNLAPHEVATAVNGEFVARAARGDRRLHAGDSVTCFRPIVGG